MRQKDYIFIEVETIAHTCAIRSERQFPLCLRNIKPSNRCLKARSTTDKHSSATLHGRLGQLLVNITIMTNIDGLIRLPHWLHTQNMIWRFRSMKSEAEKATIIHAAGKLIILSGACRSFRSF